MFRLGLGLLLGALTIASGFVPASATAAAPACTDAEPDVVAVDARATLDLLDELHALFSGLPGFVDVYYYAGEPVELRPMFVREVPAEARSVRTPVTVAFDVIPEEPQGMGPGLAPDASDLLCSGIRPGSRLNVGGAICTANFLFADNAGNTYLGTAGHCTSVGQSVTVSGFGFAGNTVFSTGNGGVGNDFALVKLTAAAAAVASPEMCDWGGPTGAFTGSGITGRRVLHTGHGYGLVLAPPRPKPGVGAGYGATSLTWAGAPWPGDSGSAIRLDGGTAVGTQGQGVGILTHGLGTGVFGVGVTGGLGFGTRLDKAIQMSGISGLQLLTVPWAHLH